MPLLGKFSRGPSTDARIPPAQVAPNRAADDDSHSDTSGIPPVPPLPTMYQFPSMAMANSNIQLLSPRALTPPSPVSPDEDRTFTIPTIDYQPLTPAKSPSRPRTESSPKGPPQKWSFSDALRLKSPPTLRKAKAMRQLVSPSQAPESRPATEPPNQSQVSSLKPSSNMLFTSPAPATPTTTAKARTPTHPTPSRTELRAITQATSQELRSRANPLVRNNAPSH